MRPTIIDIAQHANVSRTTVSNVLNGKPKCSEATRLKVRQIAEELGYQPNLGARAMVGKKTCTIGIILPDYSVKFINTEFYNKLMHSFNSFLLQYPTEYSLLTSFSNDLSFLQRWLYSRNIEGLILVDKYSRELLDFVGELRIPVVFLDNYSEPMPQCSYFNLDNLLGGQLATRHLVARGYRKIAFAGPHTRANKSSFGQRYAGYQKVMAQEGREEIHLCLPNSDFVSGKKLAEKALKMGLTAAFFVLDSAAVGFVNGLLRAGTRIPQDFGIVGFDNVDSSWQIYPALSTVNQNVIRRARKVIEHLVQRMEDATVKPLQTCTPIKLLQRETS